MATWVLTDETCNINFAENGVSHRTLPKELTVLEIVLAGEPLNDTSVDCVFVRYEGKYAIELPYNDTSIGVTTYASAELLRVAILALLNTNPCAGGGGAGTLDATLTAGNTTTQSAIFDDGVGGVNTISPASSLITDGTNITTVQGGAVITDNGAGDTSTLSTSTLSLIGAAPNISLNSTSYEETRIATTLLAFSLLIDGNLFLSTAGNLNIAGLQSFADDAAAGIGGLVSGDLYYTTSGGSTFLKIVP